MVVSALYAGMITEISGPDLLSANKSSILDHVSYAEYSLQTIRRMLFDFFEMISDWSSSDAISFI